MKRITTFLLLLLLPLFGFSQNDCTKFKTGTFKVTDPATKKVCFITRDEKNANRKMQDAEEIYDFDIVWIDDCTYTVSPTAATAARNKEVLKSGTMTVKITKVKDGSYVQRVTVANNPKFRRIDEVFAVADNK